MRLLEIEIGLFDRKIHTSGGVVEDKDCEPARCFIDLEEVETVYNDIDTDEVVILMKSGASHVTKSYDLKGFCEKWTGLCGIRKVECPDCGGTEFEPVKSDQGVFSRCKVCLRVFQPEVVK